MKYSLQEALKDLRNPKKTLKEDINTDLKSKLEAIKDPIQLVQVYENSADDTLKLTYGREAALEDYINEYFEDGYESMRINLGSSGLAPFNDDDIEGDYEFDTPEEVLEVVHKYPDYYWFLDGDPELELATKEQVIEQILEFGDPQKVEKAINTYVVDDANESLNEAKQGKVVTAATILKKSQNEIFAESTEEGMRKKVLSILEKNKDKMSPENYNTVVKTMTKCPKSAVPSTVWTMLNPNQKVGR